MGFLITLLNHPGQSSVLKPHLGRCYLLPIISINVSFLIANQFEKYS